MDGDLIFKIEATGIWGRNLLLPRSGQEKTVMITLAEGRNIRQRCQDSESNQQI